MENTGIEWAHHTHNWWWGCEKISAGCTNCYAAELDGRYFDGEHWGVDEQGEPSLRRFFGDAHWNLPRRWNRKAQAAGERHRVFSLSMGDWCEDRDDLIPHRERGLILIVDTPWLDWLLLTKRPENLGKFLPWVNPKSPTNPWPNVWLGITGENQVEYLRRRDELRKIPAARTFVSYEPALERVDFRFGEWKPDWMIAGSESGRRARPANEDWYRDARDQCEAAGVSFFYKQHVFEGQKKKVSLPVLDGRQWTEVPCSVAS